MQMNDTNSKSRPNSNDSMFNNIFNVGFGKGAIGAKRDNITQ